MKTKIQNIIKPSKLKRNATIGIIASSGPVNKDKLETNIRSLEGFGYRFKLGAHLFDQYGYLAGIDRDRADDINRMFADPEVDAIFCARGGYGTTHSRYHISLKNRAVRASRKYPLFKNIKSQAQNPNVKCPALIPELVGNQSICK
ncbi:MAG: LD-carboxypeptidase, partial [bacterium]|nr:LD-carboxypeptidase [bacterium]